MRKDGKMSLLDFLRFEFIFVLMSGEWIMSNPLTTSLPPFPQVQIISSLQIYFMLEYCLSFLWDVLIKADKSLISIAQTWLNSIGSRYHAIRSKCSTCNCVKFIHKRVIDSIAKLLIKQQNLFRAYRPSQKTFPLNLERRLLHKTFHFIFRELSNY